MPECEKGIGPKGTNNESQVKLRAHAQTNIGHREAADTLCTDLLSLSLALYLPLSFTLSRLGTEDTNVK